MARQQQQQAEIRDGAINARPQYDTSWCDRCGHNPVDKRRWRKLCKGCEWFTKALPHVGA